MWIVIEASPISSRHQTAFRLPTGLDQGQHAAHQPHAKRIEIPNRSIPSGLDSNSDSTPAGAKRYCPHFCQAASNNDRIPGWLAPALQSDGHIIRALRNIFSGPVCKLPFVSGQMLDTLVGVRAGLLFGRTLRLESPHPEG